MSSSFAGYSEVPSHLKGSELFAAQRQFQAGLVGARHKDENEGKKWHDQFMLQLELASMRPANTIFKEELDEPEPQVA